MNLSTGDLSKLFGIYMPGYACKACRMADGTITLQFSNLANQDVFTIPSLPTTQLNSVPAIRTLSKSLTEEFAITATRRGVRA